MAKVHYTGVSSPAIAFEALRPAWKQLRELSNHCRPFGPDHLILSATIQALETAAYHFTREPSFWASEDERARVRVHGRHGGDGSGDA